jgi:hypothetical protein
MKSRYLMVVLIALLVAPIPIRVSAQWSTNPAINNPIVVGSGDQILLSCIADGSGGVIFAYKDFQPANTYTRLQRINKEGQTLWGNSGVNISTSNGLDGSNCMMTSDEAGGAMVCWLEGDLITPRPRYFAKHVSSA